MSTPTISSSQIREDVLLDPRYPVHRIADQLRPYLEVIIERFHPQQIVLFGSYAYGHPSPDSDVDLLIVKAIDKSPVSDATSIRRAIRHLRHSVANLPLDIMVRSPEDLRARIDHRADFHEEILSRGLNLI
jgi:predicted nucleotidyltransferase